MKWQRFIFILTLIWTIIILSLTFSFLWGDDMNNFSFELVYITQVPNLENSPIPFNKDVYIGTQLISSTEIWNLNLSDFHNHIKENYEYSNKYDCKFYSRVWAMYFDVRGWNYNYHFLDEHVFVISENNEMYCKADLDILNCYNKEE